MARRSGILRFIVGQIEVTQSFHFAQALGGHACLAPLGTGGLPVTPHHIGLEFCQIARKGARVVKIAKVCGPDGGVLRADDRAVIRLVHGLGEHALPRAVLQRKERPALRAGHSGISLECPVLQAAFKATPAPERFRPVGAKVGPEIKL